MPKKFTSKKRSKQQAAMDSAPPEACNQPVPTFTYYGSSAVAKKLEDFARQFDLNEQLEQLEKDQSQLELMLLKINNNIEEIHKAKTNLR